METTTENDNRTLDCGHKPSPHSEHTTGTARFGGKEICWECANKMELDTFLTAKKYFCYLSGDGRKLATWPGGELAKVTGETKSRSGFFRSSITRVWATDKNGQHWYGQGPGRGMCVKVRRVK
jgi:hypothetical protein